MVHSNCLKGRIPKTKRAIPTRIKTIIFPDISERIDAPAITPIDTKEIPVTKERK